MAKHYDYFVIGAGSGGVRSARIAAQHGAKVGIAEASRLGGTCVNLGCVPKKIMAYGADYGFHFEDARGYGWDTPKDISFSWETLIANKDAEIDRLNGIYGNLLDNAGVDLFNGFAKFVDNNTLDIDGETVTADNILIAVGGTPRASNIPGAEHLVISDDVFHLETMPERVLINGGGYVAVEFAHIFHGLGAHVTLLYRGPMFLRGFDETMRMALAEEMKKAGIDLHFNCELTEVSKNDDGSLTASCTHDDITFETDLVMNAIGRVPCTDKLGLENTDVKLADNGQVITNDDYQSSVGHIYAVGDVTNRNHLTPVAIQEGHVLADRLFDGQADRSVNYYNIATAIFSYPPCSTVGLTEDEVMERKLNVRIYDGSFKPMKHQLSGRDERTVMKLIVDAATDKVIGLHMMGLDAPEIVQGFAVAMNCGATKEDFDRTMAVHPTAAEEFVTMRNCREIKDGKYCD